MEGEGEGKGKGRKCFPISLNVLPAPSAIVCVSVCPMMPRLEAYCECVCTLVGTY